MLNFKIDFWTSDEETNTKMVSGSTGKSIMYKNNLSRSQREEIRKITNLELKELTTNQYSYQSTKLYYDATNKQIVVYSSYDVEVGLWTLNWKF